MIRSAFALALTLAVLLGLNAHAFAQVGGDAPCRVALVSASVAGPINDLLDLAQAKLSAAPNLELLERKAIAKVLAEQKLSLSGLVDANSAVKVGKLLRVDTFALIEADAAGKDALGLVIYDTDTGIKWHDQTLPAGKLEEQVEAIAAAVSSAAKKRTAGIQMLRTVCILGTRNADLPRTQDHVALSVARLLERNLLASPSLTVLERKRLDWLSQEKALTGMHKELLASVVMVEVEISRAEKGMRAAAHLTDAKGRDLGKIQVESKDPSAHELATGLLAGIVRTFKAAPPATAAEPRREAQRFAQEGRRLDSQNHWETAVTALETAYALDPNDAAIRNDLAKELLVWSYWTLSGRPELGGMQTTKGLKLPLDVVRKALSAGARGYDLRLLSLQQTPATLAGMLPYTRPQETDLKLSAFALKGMHQDSIDEECLDLRRAVFDAHLRLASAELERWEIVVGTAPSRQVFGSYSVRLATFLLEVKLTRPPAGPERELIGLKWLENWRKVSQASKLSLRPYDVNLVLRESFAQSPRFVPLHTALAEHSDALVQLWGRYLLLRGRRHNKEITGSAAEQAYQAIKRAALQTIEKYQPPSKGFASVHDDLRHGCYEFLWYTQQDWRFTTEEDRFQERVAVCEFMLRRKELVLHPFLTAVNQDPLAKTHHHPERLKLIEQAQLLLAEGTPTLCAEPAYLRSTLKEIQQSILRERPDLAKQEKSQATRTPWNEARCLFRPGEVAGLLQMGPPVVHGDFVLTPIIRSEKGTNPALETVWLEILRISWKDKRPSETWARWKLPPRKPGDPPPFSVIRAACWGDEYYYLATRHGILAVGKEGAVQHLHKDIGFPALDTRALAYQQGKLFAFLEGGYFVALDARTGKLDVLASSQRRERLSPFDDGPKFQIHALRSDPARDRLLLLIEQRLNQPDDFRKDGFPKDNMNGLWEYNLKTKQLTRHLILYSDRFNTASAAEPGHWLLSHTAKDNVVDFDLATNKAQILLGSGIVGPDLHKHYAPRQQPAFPFYKYCWRHDGALWAADARRLAQVSLKDGRAAEVPGFPVETVNTKLGPPWCGIERINPNHLLLQNSSGLWSLVMPLEKDMKK